MHSLSSCVLFCYCYYCTFYRQIPPKTQMQRCTVILMQLRRVLRLTCTLILTAIATFLSGSQEGAAERGHPRLPDRLQREWSRQQWPIQHSGDESYRGQWSVHLGQPKEVCPVRGCGPGLQQSWHGPIQYWDQRHHIGRWYESLERWMEENVDGKMKEKECRRSWEAARLLGLQERVWEDMREGGKRQKLKDP